MPDPNAKKMSKAEKAEAEAAQHRATPAKQRARMEELEERARLFGDSAKQSCAEPLWAAMKEAKEENMKIRMEFKVEGAQQRRKQRAIQAAAEAARRERENAERLEREGRMEQRRAQLASAGEEQRQASTSSAASRPRTGRARLAIRTDGERA